MAARTATPAKIEATEEVEATEASEGVEESTDPWAALEQPTVVEFSRNAGRPAFDPEKVPAFIRMSLESSFAGYKPKTNAAGEELPGTGTKVWLQQAFPSSAMLVEFVKLARRYAAYKDWTVRISPIDENGAKLKPEDAKILRYAVGPKESRS